MNNRIAGLLAALLLAASLTPVSARGGFGGFGGRGGFGGGHDFGGDRDFGGMGGHGFDSIAGNKSGDSFTKNTTVNTYGHNSYQGGYHNASDYHPESATNYHPEGGTWGDQYHDNHPAGAYGYHPAGEYGYHPAGAYGYHPYGAYGHHPYNGYHAYGGIYGYPGGWASAGFADATMFTCLGMTELTQFLGMEAMASNHKKQQQPATTNITYEGGNTYINGAPAPQYYQQAQQLAGRAPQLPPPTISPISSNGAAVTPPAAQNSLPPQVAAALSAAGAGENGKGTEIANILRQRMGEGGQLPPELAQLANQNAGSGTATVSASTSENGSGGALSMIEERLAANGGSAGGAGGAGGLAQLLEKRAAGNAAAPTLAPQATPTSEKWEPLGVFSLVEPGQSKSTTLFQMAINKDGIVRGNYMNEITNEKSPIQGALNKSDSHLSWTVGNNPETVFSSNLNDLVKDKSKVLVQFGPDNSQMLGFKRMPQPSKNQSANSPNQQS